MYEVGSLLAMAALATPTALCNCGYGALSLASAAATRLLTRRLVRKNSVMSMDRWHMTLADLMAACSISIMSCTPRLHQETQTKSLTVPSLYDSSCLRAPTSFACTSLPTLLPYKPDHAFDAARRLSHTLGQCKACLHDGTRQPSRRRCHNPSKALAKAEGTILRLTMRTWRLQLYFKMYMAQRISRECLSSA